MNDNIENLETVDTLHTHTHTHTGNLFNELLNTITLGDSYKIIKDIPDNSIDLIIIDPPYEYKVGEGGGCFGIEKKKHHQQYLDITYNKNFINEDQKRVWQDKRKSREEIRHISNGFDFELLNELDRILKKINIYVWCSKHQVYPLLKHYLDKNCNIEILTWHKTNPLPTMNNTYANDTEYCIFARESGVPLYGSYETKRKYYVSTINLSDKEKFKHPTIKPINIIKNFIINSSLEEEIVLDCFSGSGTTCVAAKELNRRFIGIEIDKEYYKISKDRLEGILANGQTSMFIT